MLGTNVLCSGAHMSLIHDSLVQVEYLLNTGNLGTGSGSNIDLSQASGFTIVAEKLNFFRCAAVHESSPPASTCKEHQGCRTSSKLLFAQICNIRYIVV